MQSKRVIIIGGVAGGATAAARARRLSEDARILLIERGPDISFANCGMPYHIGGVIAQRENLLLQTPGGMLKRYGIEVRVSTEATAIDPAERTVTLRDLATGRESVEGYDDLILSPGAAPIRPELPGSDHPLVFTLRNLSDMDAINAALAGHKPTQAVVIGGGYIGMEMAEALRKRGLAVSLVEKAEQVFLAVDSEMAAPIHAQLRLHGVELHMGTSVTAIAPAEAGLSLQLSTGETLQAGIVIMAIGVRPEVHLARQAGLTIGQRGGIRVDSHMRTSDEHIYAVGDAVEVDHLVDGGKNLLPLAGPANRQGRIAADNIFGRPSTYGGSQGTAICKIFDLAVGMTGLSEKALIRAGRACEKVYIHPVSHAGYYPGATPMSLKLLFDPANGKILGAQAVGSEGVDKRIDVLAVALRAGMTVYDLEELELSYAPPYGSAKDPVNYAGFVASNVLKGDVRLFHTATALAVAPGQLLLDVRSPDEVANGTIPGARNIPLDELRQRLGELPRDKELLAFCQVGLRGYLACRILSQNGFACRNLSGGYKTFMAATARAGKKPQTPSEPSQAAPATCNCAGVPTPGNSPGAAATSCGLGAPQAAAQGQVQIVRQIDARALQCPGPILKLKAEIDGIADGQAVSILAADPAFPADIKAWCDSTGHQLAQLSPEGKACRAVIVKKPRPAVATGGNMDELKKHKTFLVFSSDLEKALAAFILANGSAAMGDKVTMFFTFWGLNVLRKENPPAVAKSLIHRAFGWMMPRGAAHLSLSKMNMGGLGKKLMLGLMKQKNVPSLQELMDSARRAGVRMVACSMSMDVMGIHREELIDGVEEGGVAAFLNSAEQGNVTIMV